MVLDEFLALDDSEKLAWLESQTAAGRSVDEICAEIDRPRSYLQGIGFTHALGKWYYLSLAAKTATNGQNMG